MRERKYLVLTVAVGTIVFVTYAPTEQAALDEYAAHRSGYDTLTEMARSATFADLAKVIAVAA